MILIVTNERDLTTDYIVLELQRRGSGYLRLNTETIARGQVTFGLERADDWSIALNARRICGSDVQAAYFRRPGVPIVDAAIRDAGERAYCAVEWTALLKNLYCRIGNRWLNSPGNIVLAEDKPRQLLLARALGFKVPAAIVTNDMSAAASFLQGPPCVAKPLREALIEGDQEKVIFTSRVASASLRNERSFAAAPMIIQREIAKKADVRVTVVGSRVFAATIRSQTDQDGSVDWRRGDGGDLSYEVITLPEEISDQCIRIVKELGLGFGAIDLILGEDGNFWFLEINPNGQWAWIENKTGLPIAQAIADELERIAGS